MTMTPPLSVGVTEKSGGLCPGVSEAEADGAAEEEDADIARRSDCCYPKQSADHEEEPNYFIAAAQECKVSRRSQWFGGLTSIPKRYRWIEKNVPARALTYPEAVESSNSQLIDRASSLALWSCAPP